MKQFLVLSFAVELLACRAASAKWEYGRFGYYRDSLSVAQQHNHDSQMQLASWTVGDSSVVTASLDDLTETVIGSHSGKPGDSEGRLFAWLGQQGWELVSCQDGLPTQILKGVNTLCWFKRQIQ